MNPGTNFISQQEASHSLRQLNVVASTGALLEAAQKGDAELLRLLIAAGVDANETDAYGRTPLHKATGYF